MVQPRRAGRELPGLHFCAPDRLRSGFAPDLRQMHPGPHLPILPEASGEQHYFSRPASSIQNPPPGKLKTGEKWLAVIMRLFIAVHGAHT
jgi:hypothetical protein